MTSERKEMSEISPAASYYKKNLKIKIMHIAKSNLAKIQKLLISNKFCVA